ncbi:MAG: SWIM zinc finger domain-containing protein [Bacteroidia bacterium]
MSLTSEFLLTLAGDPTTQKGGIEISSGKKLSGLGSKDGFLWGECSGSGSTPYLISIQLDGYTTKCDCPAYKRGKIPCKHGLGMLLYYAKDSSTFPEAAAPQWAEKWINQRIEKTKPKAETPKVEKTAEETEKLVAKKEKVATKKLDTFQKSLEDLQLWLEDIVRTGLASQEENTQGWGWEQATWMSNAKAEGLTGFIKEAAQSLTTKKSNTWTKELLYQLGELYFMVKTFQRIEKMPTAFQEELKTVSFTTPKKEQILAMNPLTLQDEWLVIGQTKFEADDDLPSGWNQKHLTGRKIWLYGKTSQKFAYLLDFLYTGPYGGGTGRYDYHLQNGTIVSAELAFYPSLVPLRAFFKRHNIVNSHFLPKFDSLENNLQSYAEQLLLNPWLKNYPFAIRNVSLISSQKKWYIIDENRHQLPFFLSNDNLYKLMASTGNQRFNLTGEWNGKSFTPYCIWTAEECITI